MSEYISLVLDELVPRLEDERGDWERVLADARLSGEAPARTEMARRPTLAPWRALSRRQPLRSLNSRRLAIIAAIAAAIALPLVALAASQNWWFFRFGEAPTPVTEVSVVKTGSWEGKAWQLTAYRSSTDGICFSMAPTPTAQSTGAGAAMACDQIEGVPRTAESKPYTPHAITFMSGSSDRLPAYIVGPVIETVSEVVIHLANGAILHTSTFEAPKELGAAIRFYATRLPELQRAPGKPRWPVEKLVGRSDDGRIVACLVVPMPEEGVRLSACR
jgi:hypothetical protein